MKLDVTRYWYQPSYHVQTWLLLPFSWLFRLGVVVRRALYRWGWMAVEKAAVPVIVVGNVTVGGTGKTPMVIWLAQWLRGLGYQPGIVSRGVGGQRHEQACLVGADADAKHVGDEALLMAQAAACPVVVCVNRAAAVKALLQQTACNVVISDDGMQHYRMGRDIEVAMVDGVRGLGNACLLPAGPLREPAKRLSEVDFVVVNGASQGDAMSMGMVLHEIVSLHQAEKRMALAAFAPKKVHALAGIGHPERFFAALRQAGFEVIEHPFPDHYAYQASDLDFPDEWPVVMTEKDAVKCKRFAKQNVWYVSVTVTVSEVFQQRLLAKLSEMSVANRV